MKRLFDLALAIIAIVFLAIPILGIMLCVRMSSPGPIFYWSNRIGIYNCIFSMPKFRSMRIDTPTIATHLLDNPDQWITPIGSFLRKTSMDELPQLWSILVGHMSFVGPRPALFNQYDLISMRTKMGIHVLRPGLTGWAQVQGRDELRVPEKVKLDLEYLQRQTFFFDLKIIWITILKVVAEDGVSH